MDRDPTAFVDIHSHLVPDVDDGARDLDDTLRAVESMTQEGIRKIITTPHVDGSLTLDPAALDERLSQVTEAFDEAARVVARLHPDVDFRRGHEVMLDVPDVDVSDPRLRLGGSRFVLIEWPRLHLPPGTTKVLHRIRGEGYVPVVAHPERYVGIDAELAGRWRDVGALLQMNYGSLEGRYGGDARRMGFEFLRRGLVDYMASDFHARPDRRLYRQEARRRFEGLGAGEAFVTLTLTNPARIFRDELPMPVPLVRADRGLWARVRGILKPESV